jgi:hypothetical protein
MLYNIGLGISGYREHGVVIVHLLARVAIAMIFLASSQTHQSSLLQQLQASRNLIDDTFRPQQSQNSHAATRDLCPSCISNDSRDHA